MSILRIAVENHLRQSRMTIRQLISAAYYKKHSKEMPPKALDEDARKWESGCNDIPILYDLIFQTELGSLPRVFYCVENNQMIRQKHKKKSGLFEARSSCS